MKDVLHDTFQRYHQARVRQLAARGIKAMQAFEAGGLFENISGIDNLWDEACWAILDGSDDDAFEAAVLTVSQFAAAETHDLLSEEISLHCYLLSHETDDDGIPPPDMTAMTKEVSEHMQETANARSFGDFEETDPDDAEVGITWALSLDDRQCLQEIKDTIWQWRSAARSGHDLLALGAILTGLESILQQEDPGLVVRIGLSNVTINVDDEADIDGHSIEIAISNEGCELCKTQYSPTGQRQSRDHETKVFAVLSPSGHFSQTSVDEWLLNARELMAHRVVIEASIDALPDYF